MSTSQDHIRKFEKSLRKSTSLEDGEIEELLGHLQDRMDHLVNTGQSETDAYLQASRELGNWQSLDKEFQRSKTTRTRSLLPLAPGSLLDNYFRTGWRNLKKSYGYFAINALGLAIGLFACLWTIIILNDQLNFNSGHATHRQIFQIKQYWNFGSFDLIDNTTAPAFGPEFPIDFPEVENSCRFWRWKRPFVSAGKRHFYEDGFTFADPSILEVFSFKLLDGNPETALAEPFSVLIKASVAAKYFGTVNPVGKTLFFQDNPDAKQINNKAFNGNSLSFTITGVIEDPAFRSSVDADFIASFSSFGDTYENNTWSGGPLTFILLKDAVPPSTLEEKLVPFLDKHIGERLTKAGQESKLLVQPIDKLDDNTILLLWGLGFVSLVVLLISCINFMNLATARSFERAKEVGIRKVQGATRSQLIYQFMLEAGILVIWALPLALLCVWFSVPLVRNATGYYFQISALLDFRAIGLILLTLLVTAILSGTYPALFLSKYDPGQVLKGNNVLHRRSLLHKSLVVSQFLVTILALSTVYVLRDQLEFATNVDTGFDKSELVVFTNWPKDDESKKANILYEQLSQVPGIQQMTVTSSFPGYALSNRIVNLQGEKVTLKEARGDENMIATFGFKLIAGRSFARNEKKGVVLNETALSYFDFSSPHEAVGQIILDELVVTGVVKDFLSYSVAQPISPVLLRINDENWNKFFLVLRTRPEQTYQILASAAGAFSKMGSNETLEYQLLDDLYDEFYESEQIINQAATSIAIVTLFIACLGLIGLSSYSAACKTKEIGIRKILGASVLEILLKLSKEYMVMVAIAVVIGIPVAYVLLDEALSIYAYRVEINPSTFLYAGLLTFSVALAAVVLQIKTVANRNPARALRYE